MVHVDADGIDNLPETPQRTSYFYV